MRWRRLSSFWFASSALVVVSFASPLAAQSDAPKPATAALSGELGAAKPFPFAFKHPEAPPEELRARRAKLAEAMKDGAAVIVSDEGPTLTSGARYKPGHEIVYFTGVETDFCALILRAKGGKIVDEKLYLPEYDAGYELWNGRRLVADDSAKALTGVATIVPLGASQFGDTYGAFETDFNQLIDDGVPLYLESAAAAGRAKTKKLQLAPKNRAGLLREYVAARKEGAKVRSLSALTGSIRAIKSPFEIACVREAVRVTGEGFLRAIKRTRPGTWEFEFDAIMQGTFLEFGCGGLPYYPIAASGPNSCVLHYSENRRQMQDGDVMLADIAAEWGWYAADVTRTFPVNGKFTPRQKQVYEAVLAGQTAAATILRPGVSWAALDDECRRAMKAAGLKDIELQPHGLGHPVGLDVHDVGGGTMQPGMLVTIEPGSYLKKEGFGVRIEDVYLITENGSECVSRDIPRAVADLEALVGADYRAK